MIHFEPVEHHIENRAHTSLCDGRPAIDTDISSEDWFALRDARKDATLCPDCQDKVNIYQFACGSVAYFAPDAPDFQEAGELKGDDLDKALRVLDARGVP